MDRIRADPAYKKAKRKAQAKADYYAKRGELPPREIDPQNITGDVIDMFEDVKAGMRIDDAIRKWAAKYL